MWNFLRSLGGSKEPQSVDDVGSDTRSEIKSLQLEIEDRDSHIANLEKDLERLRGGQERATAETVDSQFQSFFAEAAAPICQLLTQSYLVEEENKPVQSRDVLRLVKRLVRVFEDAGLQVRDKVGDDLQFDPNFHEPLSTEHSLTTGDQVNVRLAGLSYSGRVIRKAGVEPAKG